MISLLIYGCCRGRWRLSRFFRCLLWSDKFVQLNEQKTYGKQSVYVITVPNGSHLLASLQIVVFHRILVTIVTNVRHKSIVRFRCDIFTSQNPLWHFGSDKFTSQNPLWRFECAPWHFYNNVKVRDFRSAVHET